MPLIHFGGLDDECWPSEKLMLKLEAAAKGKFMYVNLYENAKPTWGVADSNTPPKHEGMNTL